MKRYKRWLMKRRINRAVMLLVKVDESMKSMNMPRYLRKRIWRDFIRSPMRRMDIINVLKGDIP